MMFGKSSVLCCIIFILSYVSDIKPECTNEVKKYSKFKKCSCPEPQDFGFDNLETCYPIGVSKYRFCRRGNPLNTYYEGTQSRSCKAIIDGGNNVSGVYWIQPEKYEKPVMVLCDMKTKGGGWTHIQKRYDGFEDFNVDFRDYKHGFGDLAGEIWMGLENMYKMTVSAVNELLIELVDRDGRAWYAQYSTFEIGSGNVGYPLKAVDGYSGDAGDSMKTHLGKKFTTKDFDQDTHKDNCAQMRHGGWWYHGCYFALLNGKYIYGELPNYISWSGILWNTSTKGSEYNFAQSRMLIRPINIGN